MLQRQERHWVRDMCAIKEATNIIYVECGCPNLEVVSVRHFLDHYSFLIIFVNIVFNMGVLYLFVFLDF